MSYFSKYFQMDRRKFRNLGAIVGATLRFTRAGTAAPATVPLHSVSNRGITIVSANPAAVHSAKAGCAIIAAM